MANVPSLSVVIPTHERPDDLVRCLHGLGRAIGPFDQVEVIVIDDGSTADYSHVLDAIDAPVQFIRQERAGPAAARNRGAALATGTYLAFMDDDCVPGQDYLRDIRKELCARPQLDALGCAIEALYEEPWAARFVQATGKIQHRQAEPHGWQLVTANAVVRRQAFEAIGGFDTNFRAAAGEDLDLSRRLAAAGFKIGVTSAAVVYHQHPASVSTLMRTALRYRAAMAKLNELDVLLHAVPESRPSQFAAGRSIRRSLAYRFRKRRTKTIVNLARKTSSPDSSTRPRRARSAVAAAAFLSYLPGTAAVVPRTYSAVRKAGYSIADAARFAIVEWAWVTLFVTPSMSSWAKTAPDTPAGSTP